MTMVDTGMAMQVDKDTSMDIDMDMAGRQGMYMRY